jgi:hypothetical protein
MRLCFNFHAAVFGVRVSTVGSSSNKYQGRDLHNKHGIRLGLYFVYVHTRSKFNNM